MSFACESVRFLYLFISINPPQLQEVIITKHLPILFMHYTQTGNEYTQSYHVGVVILI